MRIVGRAEVSNWFLPPTPLQMNAFRAAVLLFLLAGLGACTSADVALRRPREVVAHPEQRAPDVPRLPMQMPHPDARRVIPQPPQPKPGPVIVPPPESAVPSPPVPITSCDPGGCWSGGTRYEGGAGNTYLDGNGRMCQGNGTWMQCY